MITSVLSAIAQLVNLQRAYNFVNLQPAYNFFNFSVSRAEQLTG